MHLDFAIALKKLSDYLNDPTSDFGAVSQERLCTRLESDVHGFIAGEAEPTIMQVLNDLLEGDKTPRDVLMDYGLLDGH